MDSQQFSHAHPLVLNKEQSHQTKEATCSRCGEVVMSGPSFSCEQCEFYVHKKCAEAPSTIDHPFHRKHPLLLRSKPPAYYPGRLCNFCSQTCEMFIYHCSCQLVLHIKCALFSLKIAEKKLGDVAIKDPSIPTEDGNEEFESAKCYGCWEPLLGSVFFSLDCGFNLHKKCAELPHEINHPFHNKHPLVLQFCVEEFSCNICHQQIRDMGFVYYCSVSQCTFALHIKCAELPSQINRPCHRKHPLVLQFNSENLACKTCQETLHKKFVYCCSSCKFGLHIDCASPLPTIKVNSHQHTFTLFWRQVPFICDSCGLEGNYVAYICSACNLLVHKDCISVPPIIKVPRHEHPIFRTYIFPVTDFNNWNCAFCDNEVNTEYGSYYCSRCNFIAHVQCATELEGWYYIIEANDEDDEKINDDLADDPITCVIDTKGGGGQEMTKIRHFSHLHDLTSCDKVRETEKRCDGCMLPISNSFYHCSQCDFFLHKLCAEFKRRKRVWFHRCRRAMVFVSGFIFICDLCQYECTGFAYRCNECHGHVCFQCAARSYTITHQGHQHPLFFNPKSAVGDCNACGLGRGEFRCKSCNFNLHIRCSRLPHTAWHRADEHPLALTYHEGNDYSEFHYCDICEKNRNPNLWFYHCEICEFSAHPNCVLGEYAFIKPGYMYKEMDLHPHPLTFVKKIYDYTRCHKCTEHCQDLAFECTESTCDFVVHWECAKPPYFWFTRPIALYESQIVCY